MIGRQCITDVCACVCVCVVLWGEVGGWGGGAVEKCITGVCVCVSVAVGV